jgi:hypothetical protein
MFYLKIQFVPRCKHYVSVTKTNKLKCKSRCSFGDTDEKHTHCGRNVEFQMLNLVVHKVPPSFQRLTTSLKSVPEMLTIVAASQDIPPF